MNTAFFSPKKKFEKSNLHLNLIAFYKELIKPLNEEIFIAKENQKNLSKKYEEAIQRDLRQ